MRRIGSISQELGARRFSAALLHHGIENRCEPTLDSATGTYIYQVWVLDEDRLKQAEELLHRFESNPIDPVFDAPLVKEEVEVPQGPAPVQEEVQEMALARRATAPITFFFLTLCVFLFFLDSIEEAPLRVEGFGEESVLLTPIQASMLYDLPQPLEELEQSLMEFKPRAGEKPQEITPEIEQRLAEVLSKPYWQGLYQWTLLKIKTGDASNAVGPMFVKIKQGQLWRLFSPCLLHGSLLHILFNMLWLWMLGRPIEQRIGPMRTLLLTVLFGVVPNTIQYLMSGPFFIGYSGVVMGLAGFIWMRERVAPWEGYPLSRSTLWFLGIFVLAMMALQAISFIVQITTQLPFVLNIANTAHISAGLFGALLGRMSYFAWRGR